VIVVGHDLSLSGPLGIDFSVVATSGTAKAWIVAPLCPAADR